MVVANCGFVLELARSVIAIGARGESLLLPSLIFFARHVGFVVVTHFEPNVFHMHRLVFPFPPQEVR